MLLNFLFFFKKDKESSDEDKSNVKLGYWLCQSYIRPIQSAEKSKEREDLKKLVEEKICEDASSPNALKRHIEELTSSLNENLDKEEKESVLKCAKIIERKKRKLEKIERKAKYMEEQESRKNDKNKKDKYANCGLCKNPKGEKCEFELCRKCCKNKVFTELIGCKGHQLKYRTKNQDAKLENLETSLKINLN